MIDMPIWIACIGVIGFYFIGVGVLSGLIANIVTNGTPDDLDYAMSAACLQTFIAILLICDKIIGVLT